MSKPLSCPFCGGKAHISKYNPYANPNDWCWYINCVHDDVDKPSFCLGSRTEQPFYSRQDAIEAWNKRAPR